MQPVLVQDERIEDTISEAVRANVWYTMNQLLKRSDVVDRSVQNGELLVAGAVYSLGTGVVEILPEEG